MRYAAAKRCCDMRKLRRIAFTSGIATFVTRMPRTLRPPACFAACCMLSISSRPNLLIFFFVSCDPVATFEDRRQLAHRLLLSLSDEKYRSFNHYNYLAPEGRDSSESS